MMRAKSDIEGGIGDLSPGMPKIPANRRRLVVSEEINDY